MMSVAKDKDDERLRAQKKSDEEKIHEIIWETLTRLQSDIQSLNRAIDFNEENPRKLAILINARARLQQQIFYCIALLGNPKLNLLTDTGRNRDFARLIQKALLDENPAAKKMVEEAMQNKRLQNDKDVIPDSPSTQDRSSSKEES